MLQGGVGNRAAKSPIFLLFSRHIQAKTEEAERDIGGDGSKA